MTRIVVSKFGDIDKEQIKSILDIINETYDRLEPHQVQLVDALFFANSSLFRDFFSRQKIHYGVSNDSDSDFPAIHDAWRGLPRISLRMDKLNQLDDIIVTGTVRHEVGHSVLHGSLEYYIFQTPPTLARIAEKYRLTPQYTRNILYLIAIAVKDYEVTDLLNVHGYVDDQIAYIESLLKASPNDVMAWHMASGHPLAEVLCIAGRLKDILCATPLIIRSADSRKKLGGEATSGLSYLPLELSKKIVEVALQLSELRDESTHRKVEIAADLLCKEFFHNIFQRL